MENNKLLKTVFLWGSFIILVLPLLNLPPLFSPPDWGKTMIFRIVFSVLLFLFIWNSKRIPFPSLKKKESLALVLLIALAGIFFLATLFSFDRNFSLWGTPSRSGGFINFALIIFFAIGAFLIFKSKDWRKAWDIAIFAGGVPVALLAVFQWEGWFSNLITPEAGRPMSTLGNDIQLGIYLILLLFLTFAFALQTKNAIKKIAYFLAFVLFLFVIMLTQSRGAYLGIFAGFSFFVLLYPFKKLSYSLLTKFSFFALLLIPFLFVYYVNTHSELPKFIQQNATLNGISQRLNLEQFVAEEPRFSTWRVGLHAIASRPLLGYGPENFEVAFDRYYDPTYPNIEYRPQSNNSWWDRAHNFFVDNASQAGIFAVLAYLSIFFVLIFQLQKLKKAGPAMESSISQLTVHGLQATFVAYLASVFFGFDTFSTYLLSFFAIAYALSLLKKEESWGTLRLKLPWQGEKIALGLLAVGLLWFNWQFNIRPLQVNSEVNLGLYFAQMPKPRCDLAVVHMENALANGNTFLNAYASARYFDALRACQPQSAQEDQLAIAEKDYSLMKTAATLWPYHTRNWIFLAQITAILAEQKTAAKQITPEQNAQLLKEADSYFERAMTLSPKHQETYIEWIKTYIASGDWQKAIEKANACIAINPRTNDCWWLKALTETYMNDLTQSQKDLNSAYQHGLTKDNTDVLSKFANAYAITKNYAKLLQTYETLVQLDPNNTQFHSSLAATYKELGQLQKARAEALKVLQLDPSTKDSVNAFLQSL